MVVAMDFGSALIKALVFDDEKFSFYKYSISYFPQQFTRRNVIEGIRMLETISKKKIIDVQGNPTCPFYLSSALLLASSSFPQGLSQNVVSTSQVVSSFEVPVLDLGYQFLHYQDKISTVNLDPADVIKWLPFKADLSEVENYLRNKQIYSKILPIFPRDLYIEQAVARESLIHFAKNQNIAAPGELILSGGIFSLNPFLPQSLLILLDGLNTQTVTSVSVDLASALVPFGLLKLFDPETFNKVPEELMPQSLGTTLRFNTDVRVFIELGLSEPLKVELTRDSLFLFPLRSKELVNLTVYDDKNVQKKYQVSGGLIGLVIDCRGYPITLPQNSVQRLELLKDWEKSVGATGRIHEVK